MDGLFLEELSAEEGEVESSGGPEEEEDALSLEEERGSLTGVGGAVVATRGTVSAPRLSRGRSVARMPPTLPPSGDDVEPPWGAATGRDAPAAFVRRTDPAERTTPTGENPATAKLAIS